MDERQRLEWVHRNRTKKDRTRRIDDVVGRFVRGEVLRVVASPVEIAAALAEVVDDEFRAHCRITVSGRRTVVVHVDSAGLVYVLRSRWRGAIDKRLKKIRPGGYAGRVVFTFGTSGVRIKNTG